jgi:hypothetical protein
MTSYRAIAVKVSLFLCLVTPNLTSAQTETLNRKLLKEQKQISEGIDDLAERLDHFLSGKSDSKKKNETYLKLTGFAELYEGGDLRTDTAVDFSLRLPNLEEHWQVMLSSVEPEDFKSLDRRRYGVAPGARKYGAGVGLVKKLGQFQTLFQPRLIFSDPFSTFYLLQFTSKAKLTRWSIRPEFRFFADSEKGTGQSAALYFDFEWTPRLIFQFLNEEQYLDLDNLFSTNFGPQLLYQYSPRTGMSTSFTFYSISRPVYHLDHYIVNWSVRHDLYKKILFVQLTPSLKFEELYHFKGRAGYAITLELVF